MAAVEGNPSTPGSNGDSSGGGAAKLMNGFSSSGGGGPTPPPPNSIPSKTMIPSSPSSASGFDTNGGGASTPPTGGGSYMPESNGNGPAPYGSHHPSTPHHGYPGYNYSPYGPPKGGPAPPHSGGMYSSGPYGSGGGGPPGSGGPTPTLNSLLQDRRFPGAGYPEGPEGHAPGPPQGYPGGSWGYQHPGYRPQVGGRPQYGGYAGAPSPAGGYPYPRQGYPGPDPRYPGEPPAGYPPPSAQGGHPPADAASSEGGPPPAPGKHEGPPASTWTPPVQQKKRKGQSANSSEPDGGRSPSDDGRPGSTEPAPGLSRGGPSPRPRPSPSPTGSSSSRSMSPAVPSAQNPTRPASRGEANNQPNMSTAAMASPGPQYPPGGMPPNMGPPPHMYKGHGPPPPGGPGQPPYGYPAYGGPPRGPGGYGPPGPYPGYPPTRNSAPGGGPPGQYPSSYGPYGPPQPWANQNGGSKGAPPPRHPGMPASDPRLGGPPPPGSQYPMPPGGKGPYPPPGNSYNGPQYNGPGMMPPAGSSSGGPPPPGMGPPPGSSYPPGSGPPGAVSNNSASAPAPPSSTGSGGSTPPASGSEAASETGTIITTGPDGQPLHDESSQQSTLSQSSDNSGGRQTPKGAYSQGYPGTPHSAPSPGGSLASSQDDPYQRDVGSPGHWGGRVPPSPAGTPSSQAKVENLARLYEIDNHPERRAWLDKLLSFMEERGTPITQCPTISKNPLDLYRLYIYTKDRGGFLETTNKKAWKDIAAQLGIGPSSSGAYTLKKHYGKNLLPYECRFDRGGVDPAPILAQVEAQSKKKGKGAQQARPPSPGSQDSHDSMSGSQDGYGGYPGQYNNYPPPAQPPPGHPGYPGGYAGGPPRPPPDGYPPQGPPGSNYNYPQGPPRWQGDGYGPPPSGGGPPDYNRGWGGYPGPRGPGYPGGPPPPSSSGPPQGPGPQGPAPPTSSGAPPTSSAAPSSVASSSSPAPGSATPPPSGINSTAAGSSTTTSSSPSPGYPDYQKPVGNGPLPPRSPGPAPSRPPSTGHPASHHGPPGPHHGPPGHGPSGPYPPVGSGGPYPGPGGPMHGGPMGPRMMMRPSGPHVQGSAAGSPSHPVILRANSPATPGTIQDTLPPALPVQRIPNPHGYAPPSSTSSSTASGMPPPPGGYPPKGAPSSGPPGGPGSPGGPRGPYPGPPGQYGPPHRPMYPGPPGWAQNRYPSTSSSGPPRPPSGPWGHGPPSYNGPPGSWGPRGPPRPGYRPQGPPQQGMRMMGPGRREMYNFPLESIECTQPLLCKRKKLNKMEVQPVDGWRLVLALRSGLLTESSWALDTLNILLYDDNSVTYFGLSNMPGLLEALIEHWRASLVAMFDLSKDLELSNHKQDSNRKRKRERAEKQRQDRGVRWYDPQRGVEEDEASLGSVNSEVLRKGDKVRILHHQPKDFTTEARFSEKEFQVDDKDDALFVDDEGRDWDEFSAGFFAGPDLWSAGGGNSTDHILSADSMQPELRLPFVRVMKEQHEVKKEVTDIKSEPLTENGNHKSDSTSPSGKKSRQRGVRESWKVSPTKNEEAEQKLNGPTPKNDSLSDNNSNNSKNKQDDKINNSDVSKNSINSETSTQIKVKEEESCAVKDDKDSVIKSLEERSKLCFRDKEAVFNRVTSPVLEEENYQPDHASLNLVAEHQDLLGRRGICVSTIFRNLSFVPGNEGLVGNNASFLAICGKLMLHAHWHPLRNNKVRNYDKPEEEEDHSDSCTSLIEQKEWWWEHLQVIRENVLVSLSNCAGFMDLSVHPEHIVHPLLAGLLEWAVSPSAVAQDPFPAVGMHSTISPQRLALETLCKLCVMEANVDLILATPPFSRLEKLCGFLARKLYRSEDQVLREFAINLLYYFSGADSGIARTIAQQDTCVSLLIGFIEQAENNAMVVAQQHGVNALRDNPETMGTSLDMLRRAANTLANLSKHPANKQVFMKQEQRLLNLVMSQILDQGVAGIISQVIFLISRDH